VEKPLVLKGGRKAGNSSPSPKKKETGVDGWSSHAIPPHLRALEKNWRSRESLADPLHLFHRLNLGKIRREENILWVLRPHDISMILSLAGRKNRKSVMATGENYLQ